MAAVLPVGASDTEQHLVSAVRGELSPPLKEAGGGWNVDLGAPGGGELCPLGIRARDMPGAFQKGIQPKNGKRPPLPTPPPVCPDSQERDHWKISHTAPATLTRARR